MTTHDAPTLELLLRHQSLVRSIAHDLLVDPDAADYVVQQTWLSALRHAARSAEVGRSLLVRIATNLAFYRRRDERRRETRERHAANAERDVTAAQAETSLHEAAVAVARLRRAHAGRVHDGT